MVMVAVVVDKAEKGVMVGVMVVAVVDEAVVLPKS